MRQVKNDIIKNNKFKNTLLLIFIKFSLLLVLINFINIKTFYGMDFRMDTNTQEKKSFFATKIEEIKLNSLIKKSKKEENIEGFIIEDLKKIKGSNAFNKAFIATLEDAKLIRKSNAFGEASIERRKGKIASAFASLDMEILRAIGWNTNKKNIGLSIVRKLNDLHTLAINLNNKNVNNSIYASNVIVFERINQVFYYSKRLFNSQLLPYIANTLYRNDVIRNNTSITNDYISNKELRFKTWPKLKAAFAQFYYFNVGDNIYLIESGYKTNGIHFGSFVTCGQIDPDNIDREDINIENAMIYFVKSYSGYPAKNNAVGTDIAAKDLRTEVTSAKKDTVNIGFVNLRELFIYKVLENLNIGPKTNFLINPYINKGVFIVTNNLDTDTKKFFQADNLKMEGNTDLQNAITNEYDSVRNYKDYNTFYPVINLTELHFISSIFNLVDMKQDNIGYMGPETISLMNGTNEEKAKTFLKDDIKWKIVDFLVGSTSNIKMIKNNFIKGCFFNDNAGSTSFTAELLKSNNLETKIRKYYFAKKALEQFEQRLIDYYKKINEKTDNNKKQTNIIPKPNEIQKNYKEININKEKPNIIPTPNITNLKVENNFKIPPLFNEIKEEDNIQTKKEEDNEQQVEEAAIPNFILETLLDNQKTLIKNLMQETRSDLPILNNRTNAQLIGFKDGKAPNEIQDEKKKLEYLDNAFKDLNAYSNIVIENYTLLKDFINEGYNEYFTEEGELRQRNN